MAGLGQVHRRQLTAEQFERMSLAERHEVLRARLTRRGLLKAAAATALAGAGPVLVAPAADAAASASAAVWARWLAFGADPRRQMTVRWQTSGPVRRPRVRIGLDLSYGREVPARPMPLTTVRANGPRLVQYYLVAEVDGLAPGTSYHYQVVHDGVGGAEVASEDATFRTAPETGSATSFRFTAFGDQGLGATAAGMQRLVGGLDPSFHLLAGDLSYADRSGKGLAADDFVPERWGGYLRQIDPLSRSLPLMVALGNHEMEPIYSPNGYGGFETRFSMPATGPAGCPGTYSFVYGNVAVVSLDANDVAAEFPANHGYSGGRQRAWADQRLAALRADPRVDFVVAVMHQCAYSTGGHGSDAGVRRDFASLFDAHGVDLVINGHNHLYERTDPIRAGRATRAAPSAATVHPAQDGTTYVVVGGGGASLVTFGSNPERTDLAPYLGPDTVTARVQGGSIEQVEWSRARFQGHCVLCVDVSPATASAGATMRLRALDAQGRLVDSVTLRRPTPSFVEGHEGLLIAGGVGALAVVGGTTALLARRRTEQAAQA
jgi:Calcineurin-like phosphoesterase/Purple acid Phosphatase, N-terminal domain